MGFSPKTDPNISAIHFKRSVYKLDIVCPVVHSVTYAIRPQYPLYGHSVFLISST